ncbi:MAG: alkaline shock response membrane anchor protein AmaP [Firmicutes bacterium]|nr:alkaline shock response membrane anchor protein AmaP [Bacillota bacterium]MCL5039097.1 alkaline shock response membrane anchor protein AmaP [Bacillota bacterium]
MGILDRVILIVYNFTLAFLSSLIVLLALGWTSPLLWLSSSLASGQGRVLVGLSGLALFLLSLRLIYLGFRRRYGGQTVIQETPLGEVRIALEAIENLVKKVARQVPGVRDVRAGVTNQPAGVAASLRITVSPDVNIPEVSDQVQNSIKNYVRSVVGIGVTEVRIAVENITNEVKRSRVE